MEKIDKFVEKVKEIYPDSYSSFLENISKPTLKTFRINTLKDTEYTLSKLQELHINYHSGPFDNSYILEDEESYEAISKSELLDSGYIYIQGLSSMYASIVLSPKEGDKVLDLCAAPGSKTTHISSLQNNTGEVLAVETNVSRMHRLKSIISTYGVTNASVLRADGAPLMNRMPHLQSSFDKVLVDVPCSNEGSIRGLDDLDFSIWNPKLGKKLPILQKRLLSSGYLGLKPGGTLTYSTCTLSVSENEGVVDWALKTFPDLSLERIEPPFSNYVRGKTSFGNKTFHSSLENTVRILPNESFDAFYIARFYKA